MRRAKSGPGSQCLCTPAPNTSSKVIADGKDSQLENKTSSTIREPQPEVTDLDAEKKLKTAEKPPFQSHNAPQSQDVSYNAQVSDPQHSRSPYFARGNVNSISSPRNNSTGQYLGTESFLPQQVQSPFALGLGPPFIEPHDPSFQIPYRQMAPVQFGSITAKHGPLNSYPSNVASASVNGVHLGGINPLTAHASHHYQPPEAAHPINVSSNAYDDLSWNNTLVPYQTTPSSINAINPIFSNPQQQALQQGPSQNWPAPLMPLMGGGASAADDNRAQRFQAHCCTCGPGCGCLACPIHPYNDATKQEALHVGRLLSRDSPWSNGGETEILDPTKSDMLPQAIMSGEEWVDLQYSFPLSAMMDQTSVTDFETVPQRSNCCHSVDNSDELI
ncbi:MAG: hypothetical protein Q9195_004453 [Heterodermia aff. obscurata]